MLRRTLLLLALLSTASASAAQQHPLAYAPFDDVALAGDPGVGAVLNGNAVLALPDATYTALPPTGAPTTLVASLPLRGAVAFEVAASGAGDFAQTLAGPTLALPAVPVAAGISVVPVLTLQVTVSGRAEPGARLSAVASYDAPVRIAVGAIFEARFADDPVVHARAGDPELPFGGLASLDVRIDAGILCLIVFPGAVVEGPAALVQHGFTLDADAAAAPWWTLEPTFDAFGGLTTSLGYLGSALFASTDAGAPYPGALAPTPRWSRAFDLGGGEDATSFAAIGDGTGDLALVGNTSGVGAVGWFARLLPGGVLTWEQQTTQTSGGQSRPEVVHATSDGGLLALGNDGLAGGPRLDRLSGAGASIWSTRYQSTGAVLAARGLALRPGGGAVVAGSVQQGLVRRPLVLFVGPDGAVEGAFAIDLGPAITTASLVDVAPTADGGWVFAGHAYLDDAAAAIGSRNALVARIDAQHQLAFARVLGGLGFDDATGVAAAESGRIAVAGSLTSGDPRSTWIAMLESDGALASSSVYSDTTDLIFEAAVDVDAVPGGGFVVAGTRGQASAGDAWLFQVDERGMPQWWKRLGGEALDQIAEVRALAGGVSFCGRTQVTGAVPPASDLWAGRTGVDGMLRFDPALGFDAVNATPTWRASAFTAVVAPAATLTPLSTTVTPGSFAPIPTAAGVFALTL